MEFWQHVEGWRHEGRAVVVVTHLLAELGRVDPVVELSVAHGEIPARVAGTRVKGRVSSSPPCTRW